jgi:hypothetical protein
MTNGYQRVTNKKTAGSRCQSRPPAARGDTKWFEGLGYGEVVVPIKLASSSSWIIIRGVNIIIPCAPN